MEKEQLQAIKERATKATPGPWLQAIEIDDETGARNGLWFVETDGGELIAENIYDEDAQFIANARQDVPTLVAEVERLQTTIKQMLDLEAENLEGYDSELHKVGREALGISAEEYFGEGEQND